MITRRKFVQLSAATGGAFVLTPVRFATAEQNKPLRILILGGTGFTGPDQVRYAVTRGHQVTVFNRGKTHPGILPDGVEQLIGDRNGQLDALKGRRWDVVIDNPTTLPVWVREAAQVLKGNVERYVFISTISVYADTSKPVDENSALAEYKGADPMKETMKNVIDSRFQLYGPLKALSEKEAQKWFPGKTLIIRPGLIVGPGDETDRFTYWPVRIDRGGETLAPGERDDPVQFIHARDLAEWTIRMVENDATGVYNATGPAKQLGIGDMLDQIKVALNSHATLTWVSADFLEQQKVSPWSDMPVWIPPRGEEAYAARINIERALSTAVTFRVLAETTRDTLLWLKSQQPQRQAKLRARPAPDGEQQLLAGVH